MEEEIEKLIAEYDIKISNVAKSLNLLKTRIPHLRRNKEDYSIERREQAILFAQISAYHQAQADFDSLLDYI